MANGLAASGGLAQAAVFSVSGKDGSEVFSFSQGASIDQMEAAINALSDSTGVEATASGTTLQLKSADYGSAAFVDVRVISEAAGGIVTTSVGQGTREEGTDVEGQINGIEATGAGSTLTVSNSRLDITIEVDTGFTGSIAFDITGGGALFQLGPEVVSNQQSRVGISSLNTSQLGGSDGKLYELQSGGDKALDGDIVGAAAVLDDVITQVTTLRGRLGAFQKTTLETNINTLNDTLEALTEAESSIRDADFAQESAQLTRAQILVQSGVAVLSTANQNPQNVLQLLR
jgi:flagellin